MASFQFRLFGNGVNQAAPAAGFNVDFTTPISLEGITREDGIDGVGADGTDFKHVRYHLGPPLCNALLTLRCLHCAACTALLTLRC